MTSLAGIPESNIQLTTKWSDNGNHKLVTKLQSKKIRPLKSGEIIVEMLYVPLHGSFWLACHPSAIHPRRQEFLESGEFVFGNGGVGRVVATADSGTGVECGDYVCVLGHSPCKHYDCYGCSVLHRYTECDYNEGNIIGHGKGSNDGTLASYCILPRFSWELCFKKEDNPTEADLRPFMFGFLIADVRNALTRHPDSLRMRRMLLFGAGHSGHIAAYIHLHTCPEAKILVVDSNEKRAESVKSLSPDSIDTFVVPEELVMELTVNGTPSDYREDIKPTILSLAKKIKSHFKGRSCNLLFDCSSGNTTPLWDNKYMLSPTAHCIPFGFGSEGIDISKDIIQLSGLNILMSRGVGNLRNRREVIELIKAGASNFIDKYLVGDSLKLPTLADCEKFVYSNHNPPMPLHKIKHAYVTPNSL
ncbi:MAG: alcohol dehydrogenase catalytic domain-containing protein [Endomicrobiales bacterium]|nr:alcohol dehydrogenase catalytic domain-containing protein [Endomicrobiales bacterium]